MLDAKSLAGNDLFYSANKTLKLKKTLPLGEVLCYNKKQILCKQERGDCLGKYTGKLKKKLEESLRAVLPIIGIVLVLSFTIAPITPSILLSFLVGAVFLIIGMMFFTLGAEMSMTPMGERLGTSMTKSKNIIVIIVLSFILGFIVTISEPDLQVLAQQVPSVPNVTLILAVAAGVGFFLVIAFLRMLLGVALPPLLVFFYAIVFGLVFLVPESFRGVAFDSGGVTTGPMTVPFIMALGIGISSIRNDQHAANDSFGLVALCSIGPILAVLILGMIYHPTGSDYSLAAIPEINDSVELWKLFGTELPAYMKEIAVSLLPIVVFFGLFQIFSLKLSGKTLTKIVIGLVYTYIGLVLFLTGANVGFIPSGNYLGQTLASLDYRWIIIPIGAVMGYFIVKAEPAVYVLNHQVEEITDGAIPASAMGLSLSIGVAVSIGLSMVRILWGIPVLYFLIPGYAIAIGLSFFVPKIFTAIAFDSGGVASGPMTATFLLPMAQGACMAVGGDMVTDAFGVVAMVAMTPLITIQILGMIYKIKERRQDVSPMEDAYANMDEDAIIEL